MQINIISICMLMTYEREVEKFSTISFVLQFSLLNEMEREKNVRFYFFIKQSLHLWNVHVNQHAHFAPYMSTVLETLACEWTKKQMDIYIDTWGCALENHSQFDTKIDAHQSHSTVRMTKCQPYT